MPFAFGTAQRPVHRGARFSPKARRPSCRSALAATRDKASLPVSVSTTTRIVVGFGLLQRALQQRGGPAWGGPALARFACIPGGPVHAHVSVANLYPAVTSGELRRALMV
ncbi:MAG: hypothetical protein EPO01_21265 [Aquabacterium sp.]|nr:MAG: hypothetical protein EPO01_21265 [Aquabacterium sp.]